jgi:phage terminase large subunit-like protein
LGARAVKSPPPYYQFPSGAKYRYKAIANLSDAEKMRGLQLSYLGIDEISQNSKEEVQFLLTCLRSEANMNSICIGTTNPHKDNWVFDVVEWYLDEDGFVDKEKNGAIRHYVVKDNEFIFAETEEWFKENMPETVMVTNSSTGEEMYVPPKKFCFVQLTIFDNPILLRLNPRYLSELNNLPDHERASQLYGNWFATPDKVAFFDRKWVRGAAGERVKTSLPDECRKVISWDRANTEYSPQLKNTDADYTACIHMAKCKDGFFYIYGDFAKTTYDQHEQVYGKFRKASGARDNLMMLQAKHDGVDTPIVIAQDVGADGKQVFIEASKKFLSEGFRVYSSVSSISKSKMSKFEPFLSAAQNGLVFIVEDSFPDKRTLELYYKELESFQPDVNGKWRSNRRIKDDWVDVTSDCFNYLCREKVYAVPNLSAFTPPPLTAKALAYLNE